MDNNTRTIKSFPVISGDSLVQDQILIAKVGKETKEATGTVTLIENIWEDLQSTSGEWKKSGKNYFYWEIEVTDTDPEAVKEFTKVKIECPRPTPELFGFNFEESDGDSEWAAYWKSKMKETEDSPYYNENAVFSKKVVIPETSYVARVGDEQKEITLEEETISRGDIGDLGGLMMSIWS